MKLSRLLDRLRKEAPKQEPKSDQAAQSTAETVSVEKLPPSTDPEHREGGGKRKREEEETNELEERKRKLFATLDHTPTVPATSLAPPSTVPYNYNTVMSDAVSIPRRRAAFPLESTSPYHLLSFAGAELNDEGNFAKGVKWSPDGLCLLGNSNDNILRLFELPPHAVLPDSKDVNSSWSSVLKVREGDDIYDFAWFPKMNSNDPSTCAFLATSKSHPLHLWDAFTGKRRATYLAYDNVHEPVAAISCSFSHDGTKIYSGYNKEIRVFDVAEPGRGASVISTVFKKKSQKSGFASSFADSYALNGVVSSMAASSGKILALGCFNSHITLLDERSLHPTRRLPGSHKGGITHLMWSSDGNYLFSGARKDDIVKSWDMRRPETPVNSFMRKCQTNQRMSFDLTPSQSKLVTGDQDGNVLVYDTTSGRLESKVQVHNDSVNSVSIHPSLPLVSFGCGQRTFTFSATDADSDDDVESEHTISLYRAVFDAAPTTSASTSLAAQ